MQVEAVETLGEIGGAAAVAELQKLAGTHPEEQVRIEAIESLGEAGGSAGETAAFLKRIALADKSTDVQMEAIETLLELPDGAGIPALIDLARDHPVARRPARKRSNTCSRASIRLLARSSKRR